jgi:hypothetical protein
MEGGAATGMESVISAITTGLQSVATNATTALVAIIPIALGLFAIVWVARKAPDWFKSLGANKK